MPAFQQDLTITNDLATLAQVRDLVAQSVQRSGFPAAWTNRLQIAVDEAVTNTIEHGYEDQMRGSAAIHLSVHADEDEFSITISDQGAPFDPNAASDIDISQHVAAGHNGGLGVFLMRRIMDVVDYRFENGKGNRLILTKYRP